MSIVVEHDKRRREILEKALDIFMEDGYGDVTFQKIADRCGITRTTLYIYFKNKRDIFNFSIKQMQDALEFDITTINKDKSLKIKEKLIKVMTVILSRLEENRRLLSVIVDYLSFILKSGHDPGERVRRRTVRLRHIVSTMLIEGIKTGEFSCSINVRGANDLLYSILETAAFRLVILRFNSVDELKETVKLAVLGLAQ